MMNFVAVREDNCYYVNKTHYISLIERTNKFFFLIRFRRFGKSLTLSSCYGTIMTERGRQV
ncbi:AAA family ATPase [Phocaeicola vulgatus]|nr:AAA family ATPase [Phocaeicola vulgatus]MBU9037797.1 AAA family ATPase [Phocaeicola vulgatus]MBU9067487.1 AAA family ATPase [Phocaeicola vulgatus]MBV3185550.1 AAA family ATPase [Phocaeicola vulgatus]MBV3189244.1 AAA family ATPase [Phocaeicola vulgatus]MBV3196458.1 AAA family ATPase [Phocaeicola vulgatus]